MNLSQLKSIFSANGCNKIFAKILSANDNSKNQVYFGGNFEVLNILPITDIVAESPGEWTKERFKAKIHFSWIGLEGQLSVAPNAQLILYPKYPEVRFSGFLAKCQNAPSQLMSQRLPNRILFFGATKDGKVVGHVVDPESEIAAEFRQLSLPNYGMFQYIELPLYQGNKEKLLSELLRIHSKGWIKSKRLDALGNVLACEAPNCGGYTLEAELGITPNGYSEPDFLGWEVKQFGVDNFSKISSKVITLMTPEPTHGLYRSDGAEAFVRGYGYADLSGKPDRMNFGGVHRAGEVHPRTKLKLELIGYDAAEEKIRNSDGRIALVDQNQNEAASWSFSSMLLHWNRKHNQACYVPSMSFLNEGRNYCYGNSIILGTGTDFQLFLKEMSVGNIYYDPGIKVENISTKPLVKKRNQFRILSRNLPNLYRNNEVVTLK
jgi:hypothetical protein